jgi:hypothetical protein
MLGLGSDVPLLDVSYHTLFGSDAPLDVSYLRLDVDDSGVPAVIARQKVGFPLLGVRELAL